MKIDLSGKTAIVTGSTGGIGFAIARGLAEQRHQRCGLFIGKIDGHEPHT